MIRDFPLMPLSKLIQRKKDEIIIQDLETYSRITIHLNGRGISVRDKVTGRDIGTKRQFVVKAGQLVLSKIDARNGAFGVVPATCDRAIITGNFWTFDVDQELLDVIFFDFLTKTPMFIDFCVRASDGTTNRRYLQEPKFLAQKILLPPLEEQRRIVARIEELAARIEEARGLRREAMEETTDALIQAAQRRLIGEVPTAGWLPLSAYVSEIENGWSPACENHPATNNEWGVLKVGAVSIGVYQEFENKALPSSLEPRPEYEVHAGDFLMSRANTTNLVGACTLVRRTRPKLMLSDKIFRFVFREDKQIELRYLDNVLKSPALRSQIEHGASGTSPTMKNISKEKVYKLLIPTHHIDEQRRMVAYFDDLQSKIDSLKRLQAETSAELDALLPSILDKAFKGEL